MLDCDLQNMLVRIQHGVTNLKIYHNNGDWNDKDKLHWFFWDESR